MIAIRKRRFQKPVVHLSFSGLPGIESWLLLTQPQLTKMKALDV
jgi:hypothetical protein